MTLAENLDDVQTSHGYFAPMVDMLAGVVFLLVIMLASSLLVTRDDFVKTQEMASETQRIAAELAAAKQAERVYLEPRREALAAMRLLLERISQQLAARGYVATSSPNEGLLVIARPTGDPSATRDDPALAEALGTALQSELPCLAEAPARPPSCDAYGRARLETVSIGSADRALSAEANRAAALQLFARLAMKAPGLLGLRAPNGVDIVTYGSARATQSEASMPAAELRFQMHLPRIP